MSNGGYVVVKDGIAWFYDSSGLRAQFGSGDVKTAYVSGDRIVITYKDGRTEVYDAQTGSFIASH